MSHCCAALLCTLLLEQQVLLSYRSALQRTPPTGNCWWGTLGKWFNQVSLVRWSSGEESEAGWAFFWRPSTTNLETEGELEGPGSRPGSLKGSRTSLRPSASCGQAMRPQWSSPRPCLRGLALAFICPRSQPCGAWSPRLGGLGRPRGRWVGCPAHSGMMAGRGVEPVLEGAANWGLSPLSQGGALEKEHCPRNFAH